jgi:hypothetical protein
MPVFAHALPTQRVRHALVRSLRAIGMLTLALSGSWLSWSQRAALNNSALATSVAIFVSWWSSSSMKTSSASIELLATSSLSCKSCVIRNNAASLNVLKLAFMGATESVCGPAEGSGNPTFPMRDVIMDSEKGTARHVTCRGQLGQPIGEGGISLLR